ncbi:structure-specific recognition, putative [Ichthyophthirius multifiliis]|uniref:FACT complex subunit SSRP1 n=1 Tax=Ichthyophthirius multifiliis TaxID=5932 RepID=G0QWE9_ICHMU|nr:structure-specific recognition, putative [Ichthyophthirius multifiliis]EGR30466.1 structure-specific recognition, putative [Ichthyophthirius multifiliis]|eukprot:XP_004032053.1 structure-specific recognition, putative [Ichthyophthirius multifiliis]
MTDSSRCLKGINWCNLQFDEDNMVLNYKQKRLCKLPLNKIQNSTVNKNDIVIDLNTLDIKEDEDVLCEMRLYVPFQQENQSKEQENEQNEAENQKASRADQLNSEIISKAKIGQYSGASIVKFEDLPLLVPRGKYSLDMFQNSAKFHGSSYNYIVEYKNIIKAFLLPLPDEVNIAFVLGLEQPLKYGNTVHSSIVMQFRKDIQQQVKVNLDPELKKQSNLKELEEQYEGPLYEIVGQIFKQLCQIPVIMPGGFQSSDGQCCVKCTLKTHQGMLFPMKKSLIFIYKPVIHVTLTDITKVEFERVGNASLNKLFDIKVFTKSSNAHFIGFERKELDKLLEYFKSKNIQIICDENGQSNAFDDEDISESESHEEEGEGKVQRKSAKRASKAVKGQAGLPLDDDEEEDEDFDANEYDDDDDDDDDDEDDDENEEN